MLSSTPAITFRKIQIISAWHPKARRRVLKGLLDLPIPVPASAYISLAASAVEPVTEPDIAKSTETSNAECNFRVCAQVERLAGEVFAFAIERDASSIGSLPDDHT